MAGIAGVAGGRQPLDHADLVHRMSARLRYHTGSRAEHWRLAGEAALCSVRADAASAAPRPLVSDATGVCLVLFGECVGHDDDQRELGRLGHKFVGPGRDDALFCLRLYEAFGAAGFSRLSGSFCLVIHDPRTRETLLVSDRLASRPLFYGADAGGALIFATQVSAILEASGVDRTLDHGAMLEFCANQRVFGAKTYHRGVKILPPASMLRYRDGEVAIESYWSLRYRPQAGSLDDYAEELAATIRRAVRRLTDAGGRTALLLSGGLDARMILAAAETELTCYTFGDYENFETAVARHVAELKGFPFHFLQRPPNHYADMVDTAVEIGSGMHPFNHAHAVGFIDRMRSDCDSITHGYGTEILFRGTSLPRVRRTRFGIDMGPTLDTGFRATDLRSRLLVRGYSLMGKGVRELLTPAAARAMDDRLAATVDELIAAARDHASASHDAFLFPDIYYRSRFPSFVFELSMRPYIAERSIDFDNEIIDLHLRMPVEIRCGNRLWLRAMERLDRRVAHAVTANTGYSPFTPPALASALDKVRASIGRPPRRASAMRAAQSSAGVPGAGLSPISWPRFDAMIRENSALRTMIVETLSDPEALTPDLFDHGRIAKLVDDHLAGKVHARHVLFALLTLGRWCKKHAG
jgi:asparagine synthase (glutamine-hydrolysing)